jgi:hypothetical protein
MNMTCAGTRASGKAVESVEAAFRAQGAHAPYRYWLVLLFHGYSIWFQILQWFRMDRAM